MEPNYSKIFNKEILNSVDSFCKLNNIDDVDTKEYSYVDLPNPKPFLKFSIKSFEDIENGSEKLQNI